MKKFAFILSMIVISTVAANAQVSRVRVTFSEAIDTSGKDSLTISYTGLENPNLKVYEALVPVSSGPCFENTLVTNVQPADPADASLTYNAANGTYKLVWATKRTSRDICRVVYVADGDGTINSSDLAVWQSNYGSSGLQAESDSEKLDFGVRTVEGSARSLPRVPTYSFVIDPR